MGRRERFLERVSDQLKGMGIGSLFLSLFGGLWMVAALDAQPFVWLACCVLLPTSLLVLRSIGLIHTSAEVRAGEPAATDEDRARGREMGRQFGLVFMIEFGVIAVAANVLSAYGRADWIMPTIALVVGAHFMPLGRIFRYPIYYWTGGVELALCGLVTWAMRARLDAGVPLYGLIMGLSLWTTVLVMLVQARWLERAVNA